MRIVFMGTPEFAVPTLNSLWKSRHQVVSVVAQPDRPNKRGNKIAFSPVKEFALKNNIPIMQPEKIKDEAIIRQIHSLSPDVIVVVAYGQLLPKGLLDFPQYGCINIHGSLLPKYRGSAPIHWSIINGEKETGVTTMYMDAGMDTGDMIYADSVKITEETTVGSLHDALSEKGAFLLIKTLDDIELGTAPRIAQNDEMSSYAPMLSKDTGKISWNTMRSTDIHNLVRGTYPWPVAYTFYNDLKMKITKTVLSNDNETTPAVPGTMISYEPGLGIKVKTSDGAIYIQKIHMPNKKEMHIDDYLKGNALDFKVILNE